MARGGVNKAVVQIARTAILARGEHPSIDAVRIEMGNTGSKTTIHRYLKELTRAIRAAAYRMPSWRMSWLNWSPASPIACRYRPRSR